MSYSLRPGDRTVTDGVRRIARVQAAKALAEIEDPARDDVETIHQVRKRCKKLRGLLRLLRPVFEDYKRENAAVRDAARSLSGIRDASSMIEAFDRVTVSLAGELKSVDIAGLRKHLLAARDAIDTAETARRLAEVADTLTAFRKRAAGWSFGCDGVGALSGGLEAVYRDGRDALHRYAESTSAEDLHEWRKPVKYHGYHARLLCRVWPEMMVPHARIVSGLGDILGDHHDLHMFTMHMDDGPLDISRSEYKRLRALVSARQNAIESQASAIGKRLYAEPPRALAERWTAWWQAWRSEV